MSAARRRIHRHAVASLRRLLVDGLESRRLLANYALDPSFGGGDGYVDFDYSSTATSSYASDLVRDTFNGKLFTAGYSRLGSGTGGAASVSAFTANGVLDTNFSGDGLAEIPITGSAFASVDVGSDGKVLASGYDAFVNGQVLVARYNANGTPDTTFGTNGYRTFGGSGPDRGEAVKALAGGKVLVAGSLDGGSSRANFALWRLNSDGTPDTTFSGDGVATYNFYDGNDDLYDMVVLPDGSVIGVGRTVYPGEDESPAAVKFDANGNFVPSFTDNNGAYDYYQQIPVGRFTSVQRLADGTLLLTGTSAGTPFLAKMNADGYLDTSFGGGEGWVSLPPGALSVADHPAVLADGSIVAAAGIDPPGDAHFRATAWYRFDANGTLDTSFGSGGSIVFDVPAGNELSPNATTIGNQQQPIALGSGIDSAVVMRLKPVSSVDYTINGTVLTITGTDAAEQIEIRNNFNGIVFLTTGDGVSVVAQWGMFTSVEVDLRGGDDTLIVRQVLGKPVHVIGGAGTNDSVRVETSNGTDDEATLSRTRAFGGGNDVTYDADVEAVTLDLLASFDVVAIDLSSTSGPMTFTVNGGIGDDRFNLNAPLPSGVNLTLNGDDNTDTLALGSALAASATVNSAKTGIRFAGSTGAVAINSMEAVTGALPPRVTQARADVEMSQAVAFEFENLDFSSLYLGDLTITRLDGSGTYSMGLLDATNAGYTQSARWSRAAIAGTNTFVTLPDGLYRATIPIGAVNGILGEANDQAISFTFHVLAGDLDRDGDVDFADLLTLAKNYNKTGRTFSQGNIDYSANGSVDFGDLLALAKNYNKRLTSPPAALAPAAQPLSASQPATRTRRTGSEAADVVG